MTSYVKGITGIKSYFTNPNGSDVRAMVMTCDNGEEVVTGTTKVEGGGNNTCTIESLEKNVEYYITLKDYAIENTELSESGGALALYAVKFQVGTTDGIETIGADKAMVIWSEPDKLLSKD